MDNIFEKNNKRRVIPNWRNFSDTVLSNELNFSNESENIPYDLNIDEYVISYSNKKKIATAGDLLSAALVNNLINNDIVIDAANFILKNKYDSTLLLVDLAKRVISYQYNISNNDSINNINDKDELKIIIRNLITRIKPKISNHIYDPFNYAELSRLYTIIGNKEKAIKNMEIALNLAPDNRFILRAATRLFTHYEKQNFIHDFLSKRDIVKHDPWIASAEITLATILNKQSKYIKNYNALIINKNFHPFQITELSSSLATFEYFNGSIKKTKKFLRTSLISPNDNSLAQYQWLNNIEKLLDINPNYENVKNNYEALALAYFFNENYHDSIEMIYRWFLDLPFSIRPIKLGYFISSNMLEDSNKTIGLLELGIISHPKDSFIINNLAYQYALLNRVNEAEELIELKDIEYNNESWKYCIQATKGLIQFRKGNDVLGRQLYKEVINETQHLTYKEYFWLASLNLAREEIMIDSKNKEEIMNIVYQIPDKTPFYQVTRLKKEVIQRNRILEAEKY